MCEGPTLLFNGQTLCWPGGGLGGGGAGAGGCGGGGGGGGGAGGAVLIMEGIIFVTNVFDRAILQSVFSCKNLTVVDK